MRFTSLWVLALVGAIGLSAPPAWGFRDARSSLADGARIPMEVAIGEAKSVVPGQVVDAELATTENGRMVYEIDILDQGGRSHTVFVDAQNGQILTSRDGHITMFRDEGTLYRDEGTSSGAPRDSQPGMTGTNEVEPGGTNSGSTEDGGSGDRIHADQNQGGRS
jgi:regulator of RNase E activity RraB